MMAAVLIVERNGREKRNNCSLLYLAVDTFRFSSLLRSEYASIAIFSFGKR